LSGQNPSACPTKLRTSAGVLMVSDSNVLLLQQLAGTGCVCQISASF
jgi:hypothetical protein